MGRWRVTYDGSCASTLARYPQWNLAERLFDRVSARRDGGPVPSAGMGMAANVLDWCIACPARALHPHKGPRVGSLETESRRQHGPSHADRGPRVEKAPLPGRAYDFHDVHVARHTGFVSGLSEGSPSPLRGRRREYCDFLQHWSRHRRDYLWTPLANRRPAQKYDRGIGTVFGDHSSVGVWREFSASRYRAILDANGRAGCLGRGPRAPERNVR